MTFEDLPDDIRDLPLDDPVLAADVIDLVVPVADRLEGCVGAMLCDERGRGVQPVVVAPGGESLGPEHVTALVDVLAQAVPDGGLLLAVGRPGSSQPVDADRACHQAAIDACRRTGLRLWGFHVATPDEVVTLPAPPADPGLLSATA